MDRPADSRTASYAVMVDRTGAVQFGVGDMDIHETITPQLVSGRQPGPLELGGEERLCRCI